MNVCFFILFLIVLVSPIDCLYGVVEAGNDLIGVAEILAIDIYAIRRPFVEVLLDLLFRKGLWDCGLDWLGGLDLGDKSLAPLAVHCYDWHNDENGYSSSHGKCVGLVGAGACPYLSMALVSVGGVNVFDEVVKVFHVFITFILIRIRYKRVCTLV